MVHINSKRAHGIKTNTAGEISQPIARDKKDRTRMAVSVDGRQSLTTWKVLKWYDNAALLEVDIKTGRTHQIRVHFESIGSPIIGDLVYNRGKERNPLRLELERNVQAFGRQALHAYCLEFQHPISKKDLKFTAPLPKDMEQLCSRFETSVKN